MAVEKSLLSNKFLLKFKIFANLHIHLSTFSRTRISSNRVLRQNKNWYIFLGNYFGKQELVQGFGRKCLQIEIIQGILGEMYENGRLLQGFPRTISKDMTKISFPWPATPLIFCQPPLMFFAKVVLTASPLPHVFEGGMLKI